MEPLATATIAPEDYLFNIVNVCMGAVPRAEALATSIAPRAQQADGPPKRRTRVTPWYVYGGYVRDVLAGDPYRDINIWVPTHRDASKVLDSLAMYGCVVPGTLYVFSGLHEAPDVQTQLLWNISATEGGHTQANPWGPRATNGYGLSVRFGRRTIAVTLACGQVFGDTCDFTCNNLCALYGDMNLVRPRVSHTGTPWPSRSTTHLQAAWLARCVRDSVTRTLVWMTPDDVISAAIEVHISRAHRYRHMLLRGLGHRLRSFREAASLWPVTDGGGPIAVVRHDVVPAGATNDGGQESAALPSDGPSPPPSSSDGPSPPPSPRSAAPRIDSAEELRLEASTTDTSSLLSQDPAAFQIAASDGSETGEQDEDDFGNDFENDASPVPLRASECVLSQNACPVCHDTFVRNSLVVATNCNHMFHAACLIAWWHCGGSQTNRTCPVCRNTLIRRLGRSRAPPALE